MDDQRTDRESDAGVESAPAYRRFRFSMRLSLLIVALIDVSCAYFRARMDLHRRDLEHKRVGWEYQLLTAKNAREWATTPGSGAQNQLTSIDAKIADLQKQIDHSQ